MVSTTIITVLVVYLIILLAIGMWGGRESGSVAGYYVAGKKLPSWVIAFSSNTTGESGWLLLGLTGMGYLVGIHALWIVMGEVLGVTLGWVLVASRFKEYTDRYDCITVPDYLESRFQDSRHLIRLVSVVIILSMVTVYTAAQLTASGKAFSSFLDTSYTTGVLIGAAVILYYTTIGGFKAVAYSDLLQGVLMLLGLIVLPIVGIINAGGWSSLMAQLQAADPNLLEPMGEFGVSVPGVLSALGFIGIGLAFLGAPQLLTRFISARDRGEIKAEVREKQSWGLGWRLNNPPTSFGVHTSPSLRTFGHYGATGTMVWADPETGLSCAVFTTKPDFCESDAIRQCSDLVMDALIR